MTHDHRTTLSLASAALDFPLSPAEEARLAAGLQACPVCREAAAGYRAQRQLLGRLPQHDASQVTRARVMRAAERGYVPAERPWLALVAALLVLSGLLGALAAVGVGQQPRTGLVVESATPSESSGEPSPEPSAVPSTSPEPGTSGETEGEPSPFAHARLQPDTIAEVISDGVRVRSAPRVADDSERYEPLLSVGDRVFVVQGPVAASGYEWYEVVPDPLVVSRGGMEIKLPSGWVAVGGRDGELWVAEAEVSCPPAPLELDELADMTLGERLVCQGGTELNLLARTGSSAGAGLAYCADQSPEACAVEPGWLLDGGGASVWSPASLEQEGRSLDLYWEPGVDVWGGEPPVSRHVRLRGSLDHPQARDCRAYDPATDAPLVAPAETVLACRSRLVISAATELVGLPADSIAVTVTDRLRVRSLPEVSDRSERLEPLLDPRTYVLVVSGPAFADGYVWYEILAPGINAGTGTDRLAGWVADASQDGAEPWLAAATVACPEADGETSVGELAGLGAGAIACFDDETLTFEAERKVLCEDTRGIELGEPDWLIRRPMVEALSDGAQTLLAVPHPDIADRASCGEATPGRFRIEGHFDDFAARTCRWLPGESPDAPRDPRTNIYLCRITFVVTRIEPVSGG